MDEIEDVAGRVHESVQLHHDDLAARTNSRIGSSSSRPARLSLLTFRQGRSRSRRPRASANEVHCHTILICESLNSSGFVGSQTPLDDCGSDTGSFQHPHRLGHQWATVLRITRPPFNSGSNVGAASKAICGDSSRSAPQKSRRCSSAPALARSVPTRPSGRAGSGRTLRCPSLLGERSFRGSPPSRAPPELGHFPLSTSRSRTPPGASRRLAPAAPTGRLSSPGRSVYASARGALSLQYPVGGARSRRVAGLSGRGRARTDVGARRSR